MKIHQGWLLGCPNGDRISGLCHPNSSTIYKYIGEIIHLLTIDPKFLGHPSSRVNSIDKGYFTPVTH